MGRSYSKTKTQPDINAIGVYRVETQDVELSVTAVYGPRYPHRDLGLQRNRGKDDVQSEEPSGTIWKDDGKKPENSTSDYGSLSTMSHVSQVHQAPNNECTTCPPDCMTKAEKEIIIGSFKRLTQDLEPDLLIDGLFEDYVIDEKDMEDLKCIGERYRRVQCLIIKLLRSNRNTAYKSFIKHLKLRTAVFMRRNIEQTSI
ncbi:hypothetical protein DPMN_044956 [Dreissena polymorpha]|uniref:CARD domain-containing protein n=1 Tax=Dreissena polymorpha TaxID=45954 RepID=A0A9D4HZF0_DREPO|nr:hypothetical protein DPMN_044956 [Dreissena polymorpha]